MAGAGQKPKKTLAGLFSCALGGTRTPNLLIRSQMLYPLSYKRELVRFAAFFRQLPYLIRFATGGLGVVRGGDERI